MPNKPPTYGAEKRKDQAKQYDRDRANAPGRAWYFQKRWSDLRLIQLRAKPCCEQCDREGRTTAATVVDHVRPHKGDEALFFDQENLQSLCKPCHDRKTATEDGGLGRAVGRRA